MGIWGMGVGNIILAGGPLMWPLILCSVLSLAIILERLWYFFHLPSDSSLFKRHLSELIRESKIKEAVEYCEQNPSPLAEVLKVGLLKFGTSRQEIKETLQEKVGFVTPKLENRLRILLTITNLCPLIGLLGTVSGMGLIFYTLQIRAATMSPVTTADLAGGMWESLLTTITGLMIAIPSFLAHQYFANRVSDCAAELEQGAAELANLLDQKTENILPQALSEPGEL